MSWIKVVIFLSQFFKRSSLRLSDLSMFIHLVGVKPRLQSSYLNSKLHVLFTVVLK